MFMFPLIHLVSQYLIFRRELLSWRRLFM
jgi:hypothetical protein